mmetsp:Transcript_11816/g.13149  ORF Transcript_11816/g.13149 Transcript_11816/m.13149 type:complete len:103 (+) Transcript_11816:2014-2322(+)
MEGATVFPSGVTVDAYLRLDCQLLLFIFAFNARDVLLEKFPAKRLDTMRNAIVLFIYCDLTINNQFEKLLETFLIAMDKSNNILLIPKGFVTSVLSNFLLVV